MVKDKLPIAFCSMPALSTNRVLANARTRWVSVRTKTLLRFGGLTTALLLTVTSPLAARAELFNSPLERLPVAERVALRSGKVVVTGDRGRYVAKVLVKASPDVVWSVLTDYTNLSKFLPNVVSSRLIEAQGNRKVVEQVDVRQVFLVSRRSRFRTENIETAKKRIDFRLLEGDMKTLQGYWQIDPVATYPGAPVTQVLLTQDITAEPGTGTPKGLFYNLFRNGLNESLTAISQEIGRRTLQATAHHAQPQTSPTSSF
ncbi:MULTISPECIES: SRPBCC family protein [Trichocoleus]|uniref:SRPBCC family protein n=1 Tax=Trichocoleus desertorum GB2-A4 TaxID=2933944 RepID=A0ABV0J8J3_9CYAN|nr:SRPBCC family protein [Trichocoleus sp. FACHB-46]